MRSSRSSGGHVCRLNADSIAEIEQLPDRLATLENVVADRGSSWQPITLTANWERWSSAYYAPSYRVVDGFMHVSGLIRRINSSLTAIETLATLPVSPPRNVFSLALTSVGTPNTTREVRLLSNGALSVRFDGVAIDTGEWLSLDSMPPMRLAF